MIVSGRFPINGLWGCAGERRLLRYENPVLSKKWGFLFYQGGDKRQSE